MINWQNSGGTSQTQQLWEDRKKIHINILFKMSKLLVLKYQDVRSPALELKTFHCWEAKISPRSYNVFFFKFVDNELAKQNNYEKK